MPIYASSGPLTVSPEERSWEMLAELLDAHNLAIFHRVDEDTWSLGLVDLDGRRREVIAGTAAECIHQAISPTALRTCRVCKKSKPLWAYAGSKEGREGRLPRCRGCEVERVRKYRKKQRRRKGRQRARETTCSSRASASARSKV